MTILVYCITLINQLSCIQVVGMSRHPLGLKERELIHTAENHLNKNNSAQTCVRFERKGIAWQTHHWTAKNEIHAAE